MILVSLVLAVLQGGAAPEQSPPSQTVWAGSPEAGLARVIALAEAGETPAAIELAGALAATETATEALRAEAQYALGFLAAKEEDVHTADAAYGAARALAGPGELRRDATYNAGVVWFEDGERWRAQIPEIAQANGANPTGVPALPGAGAPLPQGAPAPGEEAPDPLASARASYHTARERFVERLRVDWRDADTRANLELIQRRLAELDDIEKQREEEQQEQEQQDPQEDGEESQDESQQDENSEDPSEDSESSDDAQQDDPGSQPPESNEEQEDPAEPEPEEQDPSGPEEEEAEPPGPEDPADPHEPEELEGQGAEPEEQHLTREEAQRLLDRLSEIEEAAEALRARLRESRRIPVKRDW